MHKYLLLMSTHNTVLQRLIHDHLTYLHTKTTNMYRKRPQLQLHTTIEFVYIAAHVNGKFLSQNISTYIQLPHTIISFTCLHYRPRLRSITAHAHRQSYSKSTNTTYCTCWQTYRDCLHKNNYAFVFLPDMSTQLFHMSTSIYGTCVDITILLV